MKGKAIASADELVSVPGVARFEGMEGVPGVRMSVEVSTLPATNMEVDNPPVLEKHGLPFGVILHVTMLVLYRESIYPRAAHLLR